MNRNTSGLRAGTARVDITPAGAISMGGYGQRSGKKSTGIHDPLFAKALFLTDGKMKLLCITTDLISLPDALYRRVVKDLEAAKVVKEAEICICASHTHSGPDVDESVIIAAPTRNYLDLLAARLVEVGKAAAENPVPVSLKIAVGKVDFLINRRQTVKNSLVDERVLAIEVDRVANGSPLAVIFGVGCHAVCLGHDNLLLSADYPGFAQRFLEENLGAENALFINLTEGNVIPATRPLFDSLDTRGYLGGSFADAEKIGVALGKEVLRSLNGAEWVQLEQFQVQKRRLAIRPAHTGMNVFTAYRELCRQRKIILEYLPEFRSASVLNLKPVFTLWRDASAEVIARNMDEAEMRRLMSAVSIFLVMAMRLTNPAYRRPVPVVVQTIRLNEYRLMTLPGEALVEVGLDWQKRNCPHEDKAFIIGLANGFTGYLPHPANFLEDGANFKYETIMNALEQDATSILLEQAEQMIRV